MTSIYSLPAIIDHQIVKSYISFVYFCFSFSLVQQNQSLEALPNNPTRERGNVEYFTLIFLHSRYPHGSIMRYFRSLVNFLKVFNNVDDCIAFINSIFAEKVLLIVSSSFCNLILPRIEDLQQISTIYIVCENENDINLSFQQSKINGLYTDFDDIHEQLSKDINKMARELIIYTKLSSNAISLPPIFIYIQLLSEIILDQKEHRNNLAELIDFSRQEYDGNDEELKIIDEFETNYKKNQAIDWFTRRCFISKVNEMIFTNYQGQKKKKITSKVLFLDVK